MGILADRYGKDVVHLVTVRNAVEATIFPSAISQISTDHRYSRIDPPVAKIVIGIRGGMQALAVRAIGSMASPCRFDLRTGSQEPL